MLFPPAVHLVSADTAFDRTVAAFAADQPARFLSGPSFRVVRDASMAPEQFSIQQGVLKASTSVGAAHGLQTLILLLGKPDRAVDEKPEFGFRAVCVDVARRYFPIPNLETMVRYCSSAKIPFLQLHLTDDQNWRLPSKVVPGVDRLNVDGHPAYTPAELRELESFAEDRGVQIVPELDIPGHSSLLVRRAPELFGVAGSKDGGCLNFASPQAAETCRKLLQEVGSLFPDAPYIHVGGDEAYPDGADKDSAFAAARARLGSGSTNDDLFVDFLGAMTDEVIRMGRTPIVWEGFHRTPFAQKRISKKTLVVAWEGSYYAPGDLASDGFTVVNAGWAPYYVVNHYPYDVCTLVPLEGLFAWDPRDFDIVDKPPGAPTVYRFKTSDRLAGCMLCYWEGTAVNAMRLLPERILAFGDRTWRSGDRPNFSDFMHGAELAKRIVEEAAFPFQINVEGTRAGNAEEFEEHAALALKPADPSLSLAVRFDAAAPTPTDISTQTTFDIQKDCVLAVQAFRAGRPVGEIAYRPFSRVDVTPNLAFHRPVVTDGLYDPQFPPERAVDGVADRISSYWLAYPNPSNLTVDLGAVHAVTRIEVVACWAAEAPVRYRLELSTDGKTFETVVDTSPQPVKAVPGGIVHRFPPTPARYVRIQTVGSDLYPQSMFRLNQLLVFEDK